MTEQTIEFRLDRIERALGLVIGSLLTDDPSLVERALETLVDDQLPDAPREPSQ